jgi:hypothetical protein
MEVLLTKKTKKPRLSMWKIDDEETIEATQTEHLAIDRGKTLAGSGSCLRNWITALLELLLSKYLFHIIKKVI